MAAANPIAVLWWWRRVWWRRSWWSAPAAAAPTAPCGVTAVAALTDISKARQKPRSRGAFFIPGSNDPGGRFTSSGDGASSGGANDGGDASPNAYDANGGGPSAGDASPSAFGPSRDDGRGPSALLPARGDRPPRPT